LGKKILYGLVILLFLQTCKKDEYETVNRNIGKTYFQAKIGSYSIFKVQEIIYDDFFNRIDTFKYQLIEVNDTIFDDNLGRKSMRIERSKRNNDTAKWKFLNVWYSNADNFMAERVEENKRLVKLSFPLAEDAVWNLNVFNTDNGLSLYYDFVHQKFPLNSIVYDSTLAVKSETIFNIVKEREYLEIYANHVGLIYRNQVNIDKNNTIKRGYKYKQTLIKHVP